MIMLTLKVYKLKYSILKFIDYFTRIQKLRFLSI